MFLREELLIEVAEEFSAHAPLILAARPERLPKLVGLVSKNKADFVPRGDHFISMAAALVERKLRGWRETAGQTRVVKRPAVGFSREPRQGLIREGLPRNALRTLGAILDHLEVVLNKRSDVPAGTARRIERVTDLAFELKADLRILAHYADSEVPATPAIQL